VTSVLHTADGLSLAARHWQPAQESSTGVVLVPGFTAGKDHAEVVATAAALAAAGHHVISYDGRGHGTSEGVCTLGDREELDVAAAVDAMAAVTPQVVLVGASMGAIAVLRYAAGRQGIAGVVAVSGPAKWRLPRTLRSLAAAFMTQTRPGRRLLRRLTGVRTAAGFTRPSEPVYLATRVRAPLAVVHGTHDRFLSRREAHDLHAAAAEGSRLDLVDGMGHAFGPEAVPAILDAVAWTLDEREHHIVATA
jgi:pimeloyl-ACP methyl ester carboxylesterase